MDNTPVLIFKNRACSLGALITLVWLERPFYVTEMTEENGDDPNFLTLNALGEVPTLFLDGTVLTENVAVLTHLALQDLSKNLIFKTGTHDFDQFMRALAFLATEFHKSFAPLHLAEKLTEDKKAQQDIKKNTIQVAIKEVYAYTNEHLLRTTFMYDHPMAIDAYLFAIARWGDKLFDIEKEFPHVKRFQDAMAKIRA
jgi:glutathione S-transferase